MYVSVAHRDPSSLLDPQHHASYRTAPDATVFYGEQSTLELTPRPSVPADTTFFVQPGSSSVLTVSQEVDGSAALVTMTPATKATQTTDLTLFVSYANGTSVQFPGPMVTVQELVSISVADGAVLIPGGAGVQVNVTLRASLNDLVEIDLSVPGYNMDPRDSTAKFYPGDAIGTQKTVTLSLLSTPVDDALAQITGSVTCLTNATLDGRVLILGSISVVNPSPPPPVEPPTEAPVAPSNIVLDLQDLTDGIRNLPTGASRSYRVALLTRPGRGEQVTVRFDSSTTGVVLSPATLTLGPFPQNRGNLDYLNPFYVNLAVGADFVGPFTITVETAADSNAVGSVQAVLDGTVLSNDVVDVEYDGDSSVLKLAAGETKTVRVTLKRQPIFDSACTICTGEVDVLFTVSDESKVKIVSSSSQLVFSAETWNQTQELQLQAGFDINSNTMLNAVVTAPATTTNFPASTSLPALLVLQVSDLLTIALADPTAFLVVGSSNQGAMLKVKLSQAITEDLSVTVSMPGYELFTEPASLTFSPLDTEKTIYVRIISGSPLSTTSAAVDAFVQSATSFAGGVALHNLGQVSVLELTDVIDPPADWDSLDARGQADLVLLGGETRTIGFDLKPKFRPAEGATVQIEFRHLVSGEHVITLTGASFNLDSAEAALPLSFSLSAPNLSANVTERLEMVITYPGDGTTYFFPFAEVVVMPVRFFENMLSIIIVSRRLLGF